MNGVEFYNNKWYEKANYMIKHNRQFPVLEDFYNYMISGDKAYSTASNYLRYVLEFLQFTNKRNLADIQLSDYSRYMVSIKSKTSSYRIAVYSALKKFSDFLAANKYCENHMVYMNRPKHIESQKTIDKRKHAFLTQDEVTAFINSIKQSYKGDMWKSRDLAIVMLFLTSGIRCSALCKIDISDVDFENNTITVTDKGYKVSEIHIPAETMKNIKDWLYYREKSNVEDEALFTSKYENRISQSAVYHMIHNTYSMSLNGKKISPHKFRATFGTVAYDATHDIYFVQMAMGHSNPKTTEIYIRGQNNPTAKTADIMSKFITG